MNEAGNRMNVGKPRWALMLKHMAPALEVVVRATEHGALKYWDHGWWESPALEEEYLESAQRHLMAMTAGEWHDATAHGGSGLPHWAHLAWNALAYGALALSGRLPYKSAHGDGPRTFGFTPHEDGRGVGPLTRDFGHAAPVGTTLHNQSDPSAVDVKPWGSMGPECFGGSDFEGGGGAGTRRHGRPARVRSVPGSVDPCPACGGRVCGNTGGDQ